MPSRFIAALASLVSCSHGRSYEYVTEAVRNPACRMWGHKVSLARQLLRWVPTTLRMGVSAK